MQPERVCAAAGCEKVLVPRKHAHGLCWMHYKRLWRHGDVTHSDRGGGGKFKARSEHWAWTGKTASYKAVHKRLEAEFGRAATHVCPCGERALDWAFDDPDGYSTDLSKYTALCRSCHIRKDRCAVHSAEN